MRRSLLNTKKGFTLIELLIVIGILAVLATVVILVLNPAELFKQARDSERLADIRVLEKAINIFLLYGPDAVNGDLDGPAGNFSCGSYFGASATAAGNAQKMFTGSLSIEAVGRGRTGVDGSGWLPVAFTDLTNVGLNSPIARLPKDPVNDATYNYQYACLQNPPNKWFEIDANLESTKYATGGADDKESNTKDGGDKDEYYELGNAPGLSL